jgi:aerotolerance regulator-like protein
MGFLDPAKLVFALSLAALVLIYLRARSRPTIDVSSLMLFEEIPAPVAKSHVLRVDLLFWLETLALSALTLALAGLYVRSTEPAGHHQRHALIFDLGAGMGAIDGGVSRLDAAKRDALTMIARAPAGDEFSVTGYALEAQLRSGETANKDKLREAIEGLKPYALAARLAALRAALIRAHDAHTIDLFTDRIAPGGIIEDARTSARVNVHQLGAPLPNLAIVSLDPGVPRSTAGRCLLRNFSQRPQQFELVIDLGGSEVFHSTLIVEPRAEMVIPFGPLQKGGLVHARIATADALTADNERYALAPSIAQAHALIVSPDAAVRDDLARIVLAVNPNFQVNAYDFSQFQKGTRPVRSFDLAILHDVPDTGVKALAKLFIFPEPWLERSEPQPLVPAVSTVALTEMREREGVGVLAAPVLLGPARVVALPGWMDPVAQGAGAGDRDSFSLAAIGRNDSGDIGVITFDIRNHLLLDPDRMDALVMTVDMIKALTAPQDLKIVDAGTFVRLSTFASARVVAPDGSVSALVPDEWGRIRFRPLLAGRYKVEAAGGTVEILANYYDAAESDLAASAGPPNPERAANANSGAPGEPHPTPISTWLIALALALVLAESTILMRRSMSWGVRHV